MVSSSPVAPESSEKEKARLPLQNKRKDQKGGLETEWLLWRSGQDPARDKHEAGSAHCLPDT